MRAWTAVVAVVGLLFSAAPATQNVDTFKVPAFGQVTVYRPASTPSQVVLFISGDGGWNLGVVSMADRLRDLGALVVGIDIRTFMKSLEAAKGCAYPAGALEELSRAIQLRYKLAAYERPILVGYSSGATLVYAALAAAPPESFAGAISLGFCPDLEIATPLCPMCGVKASRKSHGPGYDLAPFQGLRVSWCFSLPNVGHGFAVPSELGTAVPRGVPRIVSARPAHDAPRVSVPEVQDLPLVEVPATTATDRHDMAIIVTGDGGGRNWTRASRRASRTPAFRRSG